MKYYSVVSLRYVDGSLTDHDAYRDFGTVDEARSFFESFDPSTVYTEEELNEPESYVSVLLEEHDGEEVEVLDER